MGVKGLAPFLQKTFPEVIKLLPKRFQGLAGKKIIIDGNLITQRFHFAQAPHPYRHVLGWYRLARELKEAGVEAVCVFDGDHRHVAKAGELNRRREVRRQTAARGALEQDRSKRLRKLSKVLNRLQGLDSTTRERAASLLRQLSAEAGQDAGGIVSELTDILKHAEHQHKLPYILGDWLALDDGSFTPEFIADEELDSTLKEGQLSLFTAAYDAHYFPLGSNLSLLDDRNNQISPDHPWFQATDPSHFSDSTYLPLEPDLYTLISPFHVDELPPKQQPPSPLSAESAPTDDDILNQLAALFVDYRQSISKLASLATPLTTFPPTPPDVGDPDTQAEIVMTKAQYQLTLEEGKFWDTFVENEVPSTIVATQPPEMALAKLSHTSDVMSASFERRMNLPTKKTFTESKEILWAMGVPCLVSRGSYEAEALASSIVLNGLADYVASEDTDVLVYGAPLIRNLTTRNAPLTVVSGAEIRTVLQLNPASFIDFALLLGTDFSERIKNVGPTRALQFIREHGSIERVIELEKKCIPHISHEAYLTQVEAARMVFRTLPPVPRKARLEQRPVDEAEVIAVLRRYGLVREVMDLGEWDYGAALEGNSFKDNPFKDNPSAL